MNSLRAHAPLALLAALLLGTGAAHAQQTAVADGTPEIDAALAQKNWQGAQPLLDQRIASHPSDVQARFKRATVLARMGRDDEAIAAFRALTLAYPELPEPYNNLAALYAKQGKYEDARQTLELALKANPGFALGYRNLGDLYLRLAATAYQHADTLDHDSVAAERISRINALVAPPATHQAAVAEHSGGASTTPAASVPAATRR